MPPAFRFSSAKAHKSMTGAASARASCTGSASCSMFTFVDAAVWVARCVCMVGDAPRRCGERSACVTRQGPPLAGNGQATLPRAIDPFLEIRGQALTLLGDVGYYAGKVVDRLHVDAGRIVEALDRFAFAAGNKRKVVGVKISIERVLKGGQPDMRLVVPLQCLADVGNLPDTEPLALVVGSNRRRRHDRDAVGWRNAQPGQPVHRLVNFLDLLP